MSGGCASYVVLMVSTEDARTDPVGRRGVVGQSQESSQEEGEENGLTIAAVIAAATDLADAEGLGAVSIQRVAERLEVDTMPIRAQVPTEVQLGELIVDSALSELYDDVSTPSRAPGGWRGGLMFIARRNWESYQRHPWLLDVSSSRPVLGPHTTHKYEAELRPLDGLGLSDVEMDSVLTLVLTHVQVTARALANASRMRPAPPESAWWTAATPLRDERIDEARFPVAARVGASASQSFDATSDPVHAMAFGLEVILDGVGSLIADRTRG